MARQIIGGTIALVLMSLVAMAERLEAQDAMPAAVGWSLSGNLGPSIKMSLERESGGGYGGAALQELGATSHVDLKATSEVFLLRTGIDATAAASGFPTGKGATTISFALRELELSWLPNPAFAFRAGKLLRSLGLGLAGSPADPFAVAEGQGGFWGLAAEWSGGSSLSGVGLLSIDRAATRGALPV
jgi:hypothetical protein